MSAIISLAGALFGRLSFCALNGAIVGAIAGFLIGLLQGEHAQPLAAAEVLGVGVTLGLLGWAFILIVVGMWLHYGSSAVAWPALINALLTAVLTVWVNNLVDLQTIATLIGILIGILVGTVLCRLCRRGRWAANQ